MDHHFIVPCSTLVFLTHFQCKPCFTYKRWFFLGNCFWKPYMANPDFQCNLGTNGGKHQLQPLNVALDQLNLRQPPYKKRSKRYEKITFLDCKYLDISFFWGGKMAGLLPQKHPVESLLTEQQVICVGTWPPCHVGSLPHPITAPWDRSGEESPGSPDRIARLEEALVSQQELQLGMVPAWQFGGLGGWVVWGYSL